MSKRNQILGLAAWTALTFMASAVGAVATLDARAFYGQLTLPPWAPPGWLFGPVWTVLYALMAVAAWWVWRKEGFRAHRTALSLYVAQLALNALWSWLFFSWRNGALALAGIVLLWLLIAATIVSFWRIRPYPSILLLPYLLWVSFATALNLSIWQLNPSLLG